MAVPVFHPQVSVILKKNIGRATVSGQVASSQRFQPGGPPAPAPCSTA